MAEQATINIWHYMDHDGTRHGPVEADALRDMIRRKTMDGSEYVWTSEFGPEWKPLSGTDLWREMGLTPPLPAESINGTFVWLLAIAPLLYAWIEPAVLAALAEKNVYLTPDQRLWWPIFAMTVANSLLAGLDSKMIRRTGNIPPSFGWAIFMIPVYLWKRSNVLRTNQAPFIVWVVLFAVSLAM